MKDEEDIGCEEWNIKLTMKNSISLRATLLGLGCNYRSLSTTKSGLAFMVDTFDQNRDGIVIL